MQFEFLFLIGILFVIVFVFVFVFVFQPNIIEPCSPRVPTDDQHPGLSPQLHQSAAMLGSDLSINMCDNDDGDEDDDNDGDIMMSTMMAMLMLFFRLTMAHRFQRRQVTPASGAQIKSLDITERPIPDCQMSPQTNKKTIQTLR